MPAPLTMFYFYFFGGVGVAYIIFEGGWGVQEGFVPGNVEFWKKKTQLRVFC